MRIVAALGAFVVCASLGAGALGCGDAECRDADGDGFGPFCERGRDCDDDDSARAVLCDGGAPDCNATPTATGCPCLQGAEVSCYQAAHETLGVGPCRAGVSWCERGAFSRCEGAVLPETERCNDEDDDCDGVADEGTRSPCGGCDDGCIGGVWGPPLVPFSAGGALDVTAAGELTLRRTARQARTLWVPNTDEGTVSKIDTDFAREVARYRTAGGAPIAVVVDRRGDAYLLDRGGQGRSMLTKLAGDPSRCVAADGGSVSSSTGPEDVLDFGDDDCVLFSVPVGKAGDDARALAIDGALAPDGALAGHAWVGLSGARQLVQLDGETGAVLARVALPELAPHVAAFDPWGQLLVIDHDGLLAHVDIARTPPVVTLARVPLACYQLDALAVDAQGLAVLTGSDCERVIVFDPQSGRFEELQVPDLLTPRGIALRDGEAFVSFGSGQLGRISLSPLELTATYSLSRGERVPYDALAVSVDDLGRVWTASALGGPAGKGLVTAFDPVSEEIGAQIVVGEGPHALGDMTGTALGGEFAPEGYASHVFTGCGHESTVTDAGTSGRRTRWERLHVHAVVGPDARLALAVRHAAEVGGLAAAKYATLGTLASDSAPLSLDLPEGGVVEVRVTLRALSGLGAPRVASVGVEWKCPGPD